jgi:mannose-6-phosphate isomerase
MNHKFKYLLKEIRPWGVFYVIADEINYKIKRIEVKSGARLSYQYHEGRSELWLILEGKAKVTINGIEKFYSVGDSVSISVKSKHRVENYSNQKLVFIEIQHGQYFDEDDIIRIEDDYKRLK